MWVTENLSFEEVRYAHTKILNLCAKWLMLLGWLHPLRSNIITHQQNSRGSATRNSRKQVFRRPPIDKTFPFPV